MYDFARRFAQAVGLGEYLAGSQFLPMRLWKIAVERRGRNSHRPRYFVDIKSSGQFSAWILSSGPNAFGRPRPLLCESAPGSRRWKYRQ